MSIHFLSLLINQRSARRKDVTFDCLAIIERKSRNRNILSHNRPKSAYQYRFILATQSESKSNCKDLRLSRLLMSNDLAWWDRYYLLIIDFRSYSFAFFYRLTKVNSESDISYLSLASDTKLSVFFGQPFQSQNHH